ncbi:hypothetical protein MKW94_019376 [Papaver nudicaule]|uniref:RanBD1 domain-containing protein n=1 Tax=Papaver nudicaule TaxID=74823 RepID=A0AA41SBB8_PAPNU|nr:hypothetical protein [Papaver nudicaule]
MATKLFKCRVEREYAKGELFKFPGVIIEEDDAQMATIVVEVEDVLLDLKAKLYRFDTDTNQWKERGVGYIKLLKHKKSGKVRLVMRQSMTKKICVNHLVLPTTATTMQEHAGSEKSWLWHATDFSDGESKEEVFCVRFGTIASAKEFREIVVKAAESPVQESEERKEECT